jgi:CBS domain-containing protein
MRLSDIMSKPLLTVDSNLMARDAWTKMRVKGIRHLAVTEEGRVVGIVSHHDLARLPTDGVRVADAMTTPIVTATPRTTVREAANLLRGRAIGCLPVMDGRRAVGIVTVSDILELVGRGVERPLARSKRWTLKHRGPGRGAVPKKEHRG